MKKRILSLLLALVMITTLLPLGLYDTAWAAEVSETAEAAEVSETAEATEIASGSCGAGGVEDSSVRWVLTDDGTLTISGTGAMCDWEEPWREFEYQINRVVIESGVTTVGSNAFSNCDNLTAVELPDTLTATDVRGKFAVDAWAARRDDPGQRDQHRESCVSRLRVTDGCDHLSQRDLHWRRCFWWY